MKSRKRPSRTPKPSVGPPVHAAPTIAPAPVPFPLPKTMITAEYVPARIVSVVVRSARYDEHPNPHPPDQPAPPRTALDLTLRAEYGWAADRIIALTVTAQLRTPGAPINIDANVSLRVTFEALESTSNEMLWEFVKDAGIRIAYPFLRAHLATLTSMGSLGSVVAEPLLLSLVEPTVQAQPETV